MPVVSVGIDSTAALKGAKEYTEAVNEITDGTEEMVDATEGGKTGFMTLRDGIMLAFGEAVLQSIRQAVDIIKDFAVKSINMASDFEEVDQKFSVVFKGMEGDAKDFATVLERSFNMSAIEARKFLAGMQDILVPMGFARAGAGAMSFEMVKLAADLASFNNLPTQTVMENLTSAMVGQYETVRKYGIIINETTIQQEAANLGMEDHVKTLSAAEKAQVVFSLMVKGSADALGDAERSSGSYANQLKGLNNGIDTLQMKIGQQLLPYATSFITALNQWVQNQTNVNKVLSATLIGIQALYNGFKGLELVAHGIVVVFAMTFQGMTQVIGAVLTPVSALYDGLVKLGVMDNNPLQSMKKFSDDFSKSAIEGFQKTWKETEVMNARFEESKAKLRETAGATGELTGAQQQLTAAASAVGAGIANETDALYGYLSAAQISEAQTNGVSLSAGAFQQSVDKAADTVMERATPAIREHAQTLNALPSELGQVGNGYRRAASDADQMTNSVVRLNSAMKQNTLFSWGNGTLASTVGTLASTVNNGPKRTGETSGDMFKGWTDSDIQYWYRSNFSVVGGMQYAGDFMGYSDAALKKGAGGNTININQSLSRSDVSGIVSESNRQGSRS